MNTKGQMGFDRPREVLRPSHRVDVQWPGRGHARLLGHVRPGASTLVRVERTDHTSFIQVPGAPDRLTLPVGSMRGT